MNDSSAPAPLAGSPFDPALAESGRVPTMAVLWGVYMVSTTPFLASLLKGDTSNLARHILYATVTAVVLWMVWQGRVWAWRITVSFCMVAGLLVFVGGMLAGASHLVGWLISLAGLGYLLLGAALVSAPAIRAFLDSRWARRG